MLPFHPASSHVLPSILFDFLEDYDLLQLSTVNHIVQHQITDWLEKRRQSFLQRLFIYFESTGSYEPYKKSLTIRLRYDKNYYSNVKFLFQNIPELFQYIQHHHITYLDLGCINSYGGYPECPYRMISPVQDELQKIGTQLLNLLSTNTTLHSCNLGLFESILSHNEVSSAIKEHPSLQYLSMRSNGARTDYREDPPTLWRHTNGTFYWTHFRNT